jgi:uncharacterized protein YdeI (YjbR/CyaY-like superfamily)
MKSKKTVEDYLARHRQWRDPLMKFRKILLKTELEESIKWGAPVYSLDGKNVVGLGAFKSYVGLWFFQGTFLKDEQKVLVNAQEGKTKAQRQLRYASEEEIDYDLVESYVEEAIRNQKAGKEIRPDTNKPIEMPEELQQALNSDKELYSAFEKFTDGKKREFTDYIAQAKQQSTRIKRVEKVIPMVKNGIGLNDKYRK